MRARPPPRGVRARRPRPLPPGVAPPPTSARSRSSEPAGSASASPPTPCAPVRDDWLEEIGRYAESEGLPLHVHADEQPREIEECLAEHGIRPIELLARTGCLGPRTTVVHATHADGSELDLLRDAGARICVCPTTEANLGDGFAPVDECCERAIGICIGSDSNVRIDPLEELRELEGIARRRTGRRNVVSARIAPLLRLGRRRGGARARRLGRTSTSTARTARSRASTRRTCSLRSSSAVLPTCSADGTSSRLPSFSALWK